MTSPCPVVFDLDGTLVDSAPDIHASVNAVLRDNGLRTLTLDRVRSFIGGGVELLWAQIAAELALDPSERPRLLAAFMSRYHHATQLTRLYDGVREALDVLSQRGHPLGLCTNKPGAPTLSVLDHFGLTPYFGAVVAGDSLAVKKPDPAPLLAALRQLGADPAHPRGIFVGDSEYDAHAARAAGVPLLLFMGGYRHEPLSSLPHHAQFDDYSALPALVAELALPASSA
ncbi:phosphoglycolate phosphatase [Paracoccus sp. Z118]|uniref:phosphoglycolate phosphatase n=1 Tax=Paracoccus sp. Z118 TaxID=2851017 RepID=UPI001C2C35C2|nr:phosphoglycolate phosphatase [Paracoccus sp. Z118]MBV0893229.1 phosphoglycolate phosphatase [Paracoccus sp. Z118]